MSTTGITGSRRARALHVTDEFKQQAVRLVHDEGRASTRSRGIFTSCLVTSGTWVETRAGRPHEWADGADDRGA